MMLLFLVLSLSPMTHAKEPARVWVSASSTVGSPYRILNGEWRAKADSQFVKLHFQFERPIDLQRLEFSSCQRLLEDGFEVYFNFDQAYVFSEGGKRKVRVSVPKLDGERPKTQSLTVNFRFNEAVCIKNLKFISNEEEMPVTPANLAPASISPEGARWLVDSRSDTSWVESKFDSHSVAQFDFGGSIAINEVRFWNGSQWNSKSFKDIGRVKKLLLSGSAGENQEIDLKDQMEEQSFNVKVSGESLKLQVLEVFPGKAGPGFALGEFKAFGSDKKLYEFEVLDPVRKVAQQAILQDFSKAKLDEFIDRDLRYRDGTEVWRLRIRSDNTFYFRGYDDNLEEARAYVALGQVHVINATDKYIDVKLQGYRRAASKTELDSDPCGRRCWSKEIDFSERPFEDRVRIQLRSKSRVKVSNLTKQKERVLRFSAIVLKLIKSEE